MSLPARDDIDPEHRFDLTQIYDRPAEWDEARETLESDLDAIEAATESPLEEPADLRNLLERLESCYRRKQRLELYANLAANVATADDEASDRKRRFQDLESRVETAASAVRRYLRNTDDETLEAVVTDLDDYRRYAENLHSQSSYVCASSVEETIAAHADARRAPTEILTAAISEDFDPPSVERPDGETVDLQYGNRRAELSHSDRDYRRRVYEAYTGAMDGFEHTLTRAFAEKLTAARTVVELRNYDSIRDRDFRQRCYPESGVRSALPGAVHETMLDAVFSNLEPRHRALELRRERLGVDTLRPWDLQVSVAECEPPEITFDEASEFIVDAMAPLGDDYVDRLASLFDERRIDVYPAETKRTDIPAYCPSSAADGPFILANFKGDVRTTFFLCHELGHAMHVEHHREGPTRYATCPRPFEEVPSILHELLLAERLIDEGGAYADAARNRLLECLGGNFYGAATSSAFVHELADLVAAGTAVTPDRARESYRDRIEQVNAPVAYDDRAGRNWLGRGTRPPYSNYQYVLGATGALALRDRLRDGAITTADYRAVLRSTGREQAVDLFERLDCDVRTSEPYADAASAFGEYVEGMSIPE